MLDAHDCKSSPRVIFQELMRWRTAPEELAEMRAQARGELRFAGLRRLSDEERELAPLTADAEFEECYLLAAEAERIADERMIAAWKMDEAHDRKASRRRWSSGRKRKRPDPFADIVERLPDADAEEEASNVA